MVESGLVELFAREVYHQQHGSDQPQSRSGIVALLADRLGIDASSIAVVSGHGSPTKVVAIDCIDDETLRQGFPLAQSCRRDSTSKHD
jgi:hypothetical protein